MSRPQHLKVAREAKQDAERCGWSRVRIDYNRTHLVLTGLANGAPASVVMPRTPSDWRGRRNSVALMRRLARGGKA
jgi:hypothetical protein